ncbi:MAG: hypothetical protein K2O03_07620, partial [Lachnospiraceae bacterium]|nr:hypothetical protein [Lachnospiraceae bacterium]
TVFLTCKAQECVFGRALKDEGAFMRKFLQKLKDNKLLLDGVNVVGGFVLLVALLVFFISKAYLALLVAIWAAGLMNMANGLKSMRKKKTGAALGQSMVMLGMIILIGGTALILSAMGLF